MRDNSCIICGSKYIKSKLKGLLECETCHFNTADLSISDEELKQLYSEEYFSGKEYGNYLSDKKNIQNNFQKRLDVILKYIPETKGKKLFEIGCAYGFFLELAKRYFYKAVGIDVSSDSIKYARQVLMVDAIDGDFLNYKLSEKYDVFCMWDTIEHLKKPHLFIDKIAQHINKDGILAITTGDMDSINARFRGNKWRQIHPPTHLHYFSQKTLSALLQKHGFRVVYIAYPGLYRSVDDIAYIILALKNKKAKLYEFIKKTGLLNWSIYLNTFDLMYVVAQRMA